MFMNKFTIEAKGPRLLTRDQFREQVQARDGHKCLVCGDTEGLDSHHIMERRLWPDGGYYLDNGATVCQTHHLEAEQTIIPTGALRTLAGITSTLLPPHLYEGTRYDKWGNPFIQDSGSERSPGELFYDPSIQKVLAQSLHLFRLYTKYPRTYHLPWSPGCMSDDKIQNNLSRLEGQEVVILEKLDGENTTIYPDYIHARSLEYAPRPDRDRMKAFHAQKKGDIPTGHRICGENVWAQHSLAYTELNHFFYAFSMWERDLCLPWDETTEYLNLLDIAHAPVVYEGVYEESKIKKLCQEIDTSKVEGLVIRLASGFKMRDFQTSVVKYVRANHVRTQSHWTRKIIPNAIRYT